MSRDPWHGHVLPEHPELKGHLADVRTTLREPDLAEWDTWDPNTVLYYKLNLRPGHGLGNHLRVVVRFGSFAKLQVPLYGPIGGEVVSAYFVSRPQGGSPYEG